MAIILFTKEDGVWKEGRFEVDQMHHLLQNGWVTTTEEAAPEPEEVTPPLLEELPNDEIRQLAKAANLENWDDARIKTLIGKLRALEDGATKG